MEFDIQDNSKIVERELKPLADKKITNNKIRIQRSGVLKKICFSFN